MVTIHPRRYFSKIRAALQTVDQPEPFDAFCERHGVSKSSVKQGAVRYPTQPGKVRFGYLDDGTHVIYRDKEVQS
jgi:hypothetical protein